jgi:hypothetical protein
MLQKNKIKEQTCNFAKKLLFLKVKYLKIKVFLYGLYRGQEEEHDGEV